jgi:hypothetical protein
MTRKTLIGSEIRKELRRALFYAKEVWCHEK